MSMKSKIQVLKQDVVYAKEQLREAETKIKQQEVQINNQFECIVKLKSKHS